MPWNGAAPNQSFGRTDGTRIGDTTWNQARVAGVNIITAGHDAHDSDMKDGVNACLKKDGGNTATASIPMGGFTLTGIANATAKTNPASFADVADNKGQYVGTVGGTADAITLTPTIAIAAYAAGQRFQFLASGTNTGAVTVNISGLGVKDIRNRDAAFTVLAAGVIVSGIMQDIEYDGTRFQYFGAGSAFQPSDATLTSIAALGTAADRLAYTTGVDTWAEAVITTAGRALIDDATTAAQRTTLGVDGYTSRGDANYTILNTDRTIAVTSALTAARVFTFPAANTVPLGHEILVADAAANISATNTVTLTRAGADTINNAATTFILNAAGAACLIRSDGVSKWLIQAIGSAGTAGVSTFNTRSGAVVLTAADIYQVNPYGAL